MRVYGGCIEPGGMELDDDTWGGLKVRVKSSPW